MNTPYFVTAQHRLVKKLKFLFSDNLVPRGEAAAKASGDSAPKTRPNLSHRRSYEPTAPIERRTIVDDDEEESDEELRKVESAGQNGWDTFLHSAGGSSRNDSGVVTDDRASRKHRTRSPRKERHHHEERSYNDDDESHHRRGARSPAKISKSKVERSASDITFDYTPEQGDSRIITSRETDCHTGPSWAPAHSTPRKHRKYYNKNRKYLPQMDK